MLKIGKQSPAKSKMKDLSNYKEALYFTPILDDYGTGTMTEQYVSTNEEKKITRKVFIIETSTNKYALKSIKCDPSNAEEIKDAENEFNTTMEYSNMNIHIIKPLDLMKTEFNGSFYIEILYEYRGSDLIPLIGNAKAKEIIEIAKKLLNPLAFLESRGVLHSDIKPANILYQNGFITIIDFGVSRKFSLAQLLTTTTTLAGKIKGLTSIYAPPEVICPNDKNNLNKFDVYCYGMTLYQLITGKKPEILEYEKEHYKNDNLSYRQYIEMVSEIRLPADPTGNLTAMFIPILVKTLAFQPKDRPSFAELALLLGDQTQEQDAPVKIVPSGNSDLEAKVKSLEESLKKKDMELASKLGSYESKLNFINQEFLKKSAEIEAKNSKIADLNEALKDEQKESARLRKEINAFKNKSVDSGNSDIIYKYEQQIAVLNSKLNAKDDKISNLESLVSKYKTNFQIPINTNPYEIYKFGSKVASLEEIKPYTQPLVAKLKSQCSTELAKKIIDAADNISKGEAEHILVTGEKMKDTGAQLLCLTLRCNLKLIVIDMGFCGIGAEGAKAIGASLYGNPTLKMLGLGFELNALVKRKQEKSDIPAQILLIGLLTGAHINTESLKKPSRESIIPDPIKSDKSRWNILTSEGIKAIADGLRNNQVLTHLDLSFTDACDSDVYVLKNAINANNSLRYLFLYYNENVNDKTGKTYGFRSGIKLKFSATKLS